MLKKYVLIVIGILLVLVIGGVVFLWSDMKGAQREVISHIERVTGLQIRVGGDASVRLWPLPRIALENVYVGLEAQFPFIEAERVYLKFSPLSLLLGQVEVKYIAFENAQISLNPRNFKALRNRLAQGNFQQRVEIDLLDWANSTLTYTDEAQHELYRLDDLAAQLDLSHAVGGTREITGSFKYGALPLNFKVIAAALGTPEASLEGLIFHPETRTALRLQGLLNPVLSIPGSGQAPASLTAPWGQGRFYFETFGLSSLWSQWRQAAFPVEGFSQFLSVQGNLGLLSDRVELSDAEVQLTGTKGRGKIILFKDTGDLRVSLDFERVDLTALKGVMGSLRALMGKIERTLRLDVNIRQLSGLQRSFKDVMAILEMREGVLNLSTLTFQDETGLSYRLAGRLTPQDSGGSFTWDDMMLKWGPNDVAGTMRVSPTLAGWHVQGNIKGDFLDLRGLQSQSTLWGLGDLSGEVEVSFKDVAWGSQMFSGLLGKVLKDENFLRFAPLSLQTETGASLYLNGNMLRFKQGETERYGMGDMAYRFEGKRFEELYKTLPFLGFLDKLPYKGKVVVEGKTQGSLARRAVELSLKGEGLSLALKGMVGEREKSVKIDLFYDQLLQVIPFLSQISLPTHVVGTWVEKEGESRLEDLTIYSEQAKWVGDLRYDGKKISGELSIDTLRFNPLSGGESLGADPLEYLSREPNPLLAHTLKNLSANLTLRIKRWLFGQQVLEDTQIQINVIKGIGDLQIKGGLMGGQASLNVKLQPPYYKGSFDIKDALIAAPLTGWKEFDVLKGILFISMPFQTYGESEYELVSGLSGALNISLREGLVGGFSLDDITQRIRQTRPGSEKQIPLIITQGLKIGVTMVKELTFESTLKLGVLETTRFNLQGPFGSVMGNFLLDLRHRQIGSNKFVLSFSKLSNQEPITATLVLKGALYRMERVMEMKDMVYQISRRLGFYEKNPDFNPTP